MIKNVYKLFLYALFFFSISTLLIFKGWERISGRPMEPVVFNYSPSVPTGFYFLERKKALSQNSGPLETVQILLYFFTAFLSFTLVGFTTTVINLDIKRNKQVEKENDAKIRFSENLSALSHWMDFSIERGIINDLLNNVTDKHQIRQINLLKRRIENKYEKREGLLHCINSNSEFETSEVNLSKLINSIITLHGIDKKILFHIKFETRYSVDIKLKAVPFEVYFFFQNIISNSVEAIINHIPPNDTDIKHIITITSTLKSNMAVITITDTGPGFPSTNNKEKVDINKIKSTKQTGGFGFKYIKSIATRYDWNIHISNSPEGGSITEIIIKDYKKEE